MSSTPIDTIFQHDTSLNRETSLFVLSASTLDLLFETHHEFKPWNVKSRDLKIRHKNFPRGVVRQIQLHFWNSRTVINNELKLQPMFNIENKNIVF